MIKQRGNLIYLKDSDINDAESFIRKALDHEQILEWAYILHDKDCYNEHDLESRRYGAQYCWADGFIGMEKYSSMDEYIKEQMNMPPHIGDKKDDMWVVFCITDKECKKDTVAGWFNKLGCEIQRSLDETTIPDQVKNLTQEDNGSRLMEKHLYTDDEVEANFDFRAYINDPPKVNKRLKKLKDIFIPGYLSE